MLFRSQSRAASRWNRSRQTFLARALWLLLVPAFVRAARELPDVEFVLVGSWVALELAVVAVHLMRLGDTLIGKGLWTALHLTFFVVYSGLVLGLHAMALQVVDGREPVLQTLTSLLDRGPAYLLASVLYLLAVAAGLCLLLAPGIYIAVRFALFGQVLAAGPASAMDALREAGALSRGRWWEMLRFLLASWALSLAGMAVMGVGLLIAFPVTMIAATQLFREWQRERGQTTPAR